MSLSIPTAPSPSWTTILWTLPPPIGSRVSSRRCLLPPPNSKSLPMMSSSQPQVASWERICPSEHRSSSIWPPVPLLESTSEVSLSLPTLRPFRARTIRRSSVPARPSPSVFRASPPPPAQPRPVSPPISSCLDSVAFREAFWRRSPHQLFHSIPASIFRRDHRRDRGAKRRHCASLGAH